jgi:lipopolysaccharide biosynthesis protein
LFPGHYQPHLPGELGFYDLRLGETRSSQAELARSHGIEGFCYYHYWFGSGQRMLERPFTEVLATKEPQYPFCLAWANQTWTGIWHGAPGRVLIRQTYPDDDDHRRHFEAVAAAFMDPRAIRVNGRPLFVVYRPQDLPRAAHFVELWQTMAVDAGLPGLYLVGRSTGEWIPTEHGFDANLASQVTPPFANRLAQDRWARYRPDWIASALSRRSSLLPAIYSFDRWSDHIPWLVGRGVSFPTIVPSWDNTPRAGRRGTLYHGASPELFGAQVERAIHLVAGSTIDERIVFVQAWNEWAEGNHLEPDRRFGRGFLHALRSAISVHESDGSHCSTVVR